jgi:acyl-CoA reductase-like NAD-dependent aldehyde dehydrogenase
MLVSYGSLFIGGEWVRPSSPARIDVTSASTEEFIANDSDYGLGGSVWTADPERGKDVARRVRTGTIGINRYLPDPGAPFGGVKASGIGRELGPDAITAYQQFKSIYA